jgi:histidinol-phosphate aminotransferase
VKGVKRAFCSRDSETLYFVSGFDRRSESQEDDMDLARDRSWSCYPQGASLARRGFLQALAAAAAGVSLPRLGFGQEGAGEPLPDFPVGGFPKGSVRLNFNENPLGPSPKAIAAVLENGLRESNRYNLIESLIERLARHHDVPAKSVLVGCGSTEFLQFTPWAYLQEGGNIVLPVPTYGWCGGVAKSMGRDVVEVPLGPEGRLDTAALKKAINRDTRMLYVANPNNPTGAGISLDEVEALAGALPQGAMFLVDEAYNDFLPEGKSAIDLVRKGAPILVTRTFSKGFGLAGLRLGYAIGPDEVLEKLKNVWWGDLGINTAVFVAAPAALDDKEHVAGYVRTVDAGLDQLKSGLAKKGFKSYPHRAPFFMVDMGKTARPLVKALLQKNVYVRDGSAWDMPTFLRVSVGTAEENEGFLRILSEIG